LGCAGRIFDLKAARLTVNQSLERLGSKTAFKPPKTAGSRRTIALPALTVEALSAHRAEQARIGAGELVFSHGGIPWDPDSLTKAFDRLIQATEVRRITFHGLCHTHISHQLMDGVHVKVVSERAGQQTSASPFRFTRPSSLRYKLTRLPGSMRGSGGKSRTQSVPSRCQLGLFRRGANS